MGARGRKSSASREMAALTQAQIIDRPDAPYNLTDAEADHWRRIVEAESADHFPASTHQDLAQLCRHIVNSDRVAMLIEQFCESESSELDDYDKLLKMQERETRAILSASTRLRISNQARYDKSKKRTAATKKPWQNDA